MDFYDVQLIRQIDNETSVFHRTILTDNIEDYTKQIYTCNDFTMKEIWELILPDDPKKIEKFNHTWHLDFNKKGWKDLNECFPSVTRYKRYNPYLFTKVKVEKTTVSFNEMLKYDSEKVIQYCLERGMNFLRV